MKKFLDIEPWHVGSKIIKAFGRMWLCSLFMGAEVVPEDIGRRIYLVRGRLEAETNEEREKRQKKRFVRCVLCMKPFHGSKACFHMGKEVCADCCYQKYKNKHSI